jgi:Outer membrane protein beta-barrel domain
MEEMNKHKSADELLRLRFEGAEVLPPATAWNEIEKRLDDKNKKRPIYFYWLMGVLLLVISVSAVIYYHYSVNSVSNDTALLAQSNAPIPLVDSIDHATTLQNKINQTTKSTASLLTTKNEKLEEEKKISAIEKNKNTPTSVTDLQEIKNKSLADNPLSTVKAHSIATNKNKTTPPIATATLPAIAEKRETNKNTLKNAVDNVRNNTDETTSINNKVAFKKNKINIKNKTEKIKDSNEVVIKSVPLPKATKKQVMATTKRVTAPAFLIVPENDSTLKKETVKKELPTTFTKALSVSENATTEKEKVIVVKTEEEKIALLVPIKVDSIALTWSSKTISDSIINVIDSSQTASSAKLLMVKKDSIKLQTEEAAFLKTISFYFSPDYYMNNIQDGSGQNVQDEKRSPRYSAGMKFSYTVLDKLIVRIGIAYSEIKQHQEEHAAVFDRYVNESFVFHSSLGDMAVDHATMLDGYSPLAPSSITQFPFRYTYSQQVKFIQMPLELKYGFNFKRMGLSLIAGVNTQYAFKQHGEVDIIKEHVTNVITYTTLNIRPFNFSGILGICADFKLTNRFSLYLEPHTRINFTSIGKSANVKSTPYFFGANAGLAIHF